METCKKLGGKKFAILILGLGISALMLTVIQPPFSLSHLAWIALVPFILVCSQAVSVKRLAVCAYLISFLYWLCNLYWIGPVTLAGLIAFCLYTALLWPAAALMVRFCRDRKIPLLIAVPVIFVGAEQLQGLFLGGFYWRFLGHSQYANITLIQIADIFGAAGVSFLVAMVNALIVELLLAVKCRRLFKTVNLIKVLTVFIAVGATIFYGRWRIAQLETSVEQGPKVAAIQSNVPQSVKESLQADDRILGDLLANSAESFNAGAELAVWPETMVQKILSSRVWPFLVTPETHKESDKTLKEHAKDKGYVLVGAYGARIGREDLTASLLSYNSAFLYKPDGTRDGREYNKIHLVPFGEVVPFRKNFKWLHKLLMKFTPYDYDYSLEAGTEFTVFEMTSQERRYRFGVMICYEDSVPYIARRFALDNKGQKRLDWLINISNDGWFVKFKDGEVIPSTEQAQRTAICVFRAVENRLAVIRSVNTGISCFIDSLGRIKNDYLAGNLPKKAMARKAVEGWLIDSVPIDKRVTFFSKYGRLLDFCCAVCFVLLIITAVIKLKLKKQKITGA